MTKAIVHIPSVKGRGVPVPSVCQFGAIVLWKRRRLTGNGIERLGLVFDPTAQSFAVARLGSVPIMRRACGRATIVQGIALWKGGVIGHGVGGGVNISIEYAFRNLDKAQFLKVLFGVAYIW